jgi:ATP-dependent Clp protease ATP-binding subunit ClpA
MLQIVEKSLAALRSGLTSKKVSLDVTEAAKQWLIKKGFDPAYGARPLERVVDRELKQRLVKELLFGPLVKGGGCLVDVEGEELTLTAKMSDAKVRSGRDDRKGTKKSAEG